MNKIGITTRLTLSKHGEIRDTLDIRWNKLLKNLGFETIIIPTGIEYKDFLNSQSIKRIIFTGGNDLSSLNKNNLSSIRDKKEKIILNYALDNSLTVLGVCRGMQFIAEEFGSTLKKVSNHISQEHKLSVVNTFWGSSILSSIKSAVYYYEFAIEKLGSDLIQVAESEDSSIESFIHKNKKIFCCMWHPEREEKFDPEHIERFKNLIK